MATYTEPKDTELANTWPYWVRRLRSEVDGLVSLAQGPPGQGLAWRSNWIPDEDYHEYDLVESGGSCYICTNNHYSQAGNAPPNPTYWALVVQRGAQGPQGPQGTQGVSGPAGPPGISWRGNWIAGTSYIPLDAVYYGGSAWICTTSHIAGSTFSAGFWTLLAAQGAQGPAGSDIYIHTPSLTGSAMWIVYTDLPTQYKRVVWYLNVVNTEPYRIQSIHGAANGTELVLFGKEGRAYLSTTLDPDPNEVYCNRGFLDATIEISAGDIVTLYKGATYWVVSTHTSHRGV